MVSGLCLLPAGAMMLVLSSTAARMIHAIGAPRTLAFGAVVDDGSIHPVPASPIVAVAPVS